MPVKNNLQADGDGFTYTISKGDPSFLLVIHMGSNSEKIISLKNFFLK
jgi:hypothetical protein